ncbi:polysaccharide deacetylase family protein [Propionicicella superfundia]|uniref:polysaccharide deacetylase family protein n=1 Tax=Propionicicella superfundia TaxID=348582 RepID=UPI00041842E1|nr:polysaccharide deacetylase family protein [Propionicicella superfundia]
MSTRTDAVVAVVSVVALAVSMVGCARAATVVTADPVASTATPAASATVAAPSAAASSASVASASASATATGSASSASPRTAQPSTARATATGSKSGAANGTARRAVTQPALGTKVDCSRHACVALTFDDGPGSQAASLVQTLTAARVPATFFFLSSVAANNPSGAASVAANPYMEIGDHSISHPALPKLGTEGMTKQIAGSKQRLEAQTGRRITLFRPPYGAMNAAVKKLCAANGMAIITWDVDTLDWKHRSADKLTSVAMSEVRPGSIILMHDIHSSTVKGVPKLIATLNKAGYTMVTVSTLLGTTSPGKVYTGRS